MDETDEPDAPSTGPEQPGPSTPPPKPPPANSRESFYSGLADDFGQAAGEPGPRP